MTRALLAALAIIAADFIYRTMLRPQIRKALWGPTITANELRAWFDMPPLEAR